MKQTILLFLFFIQCNQAYASLPPLDRHTFITATGVSLGVAGMALAAWGYNNNVKDDSWTRRIHKDEELERKLAKNESNKNMLKNFGKCCGLLTLSSMGYYFWARSKK